MKTHFCLVCGALAGITIQHFTAFAEATKPNSTSVVPTLPPPLHHSQTDEARGQL